MSALTAPARPTPTTVADVELLAIAYAAAHPHLDQLPVRIATHEPTGALVVSWTNSAGRPLIGAVTLWVHPTNGTWTTGGSPGPRQALRTLGLPCP